MLIPRARHAQSSALLRVDRLPVVSAINRTGYDGVVRELRDICQEQAWFVHSLYPSTSSFVLIRYFLSDQDF